MQMSAPEELFFHYLSILVILPQRRTDFLQIIDAYGQRDPNASLSKNDTNKFDLVQ